MACPLFIPESSLGELVSVAAPLGDLYGGSCAADPGITVTPETVRKYCNFGYARGHCPLAGQSDSDAVRLLVRSARGGVVEISWAVERNHHPVAVGVVDVDTGLIATGEPLARQAYACAAAYVRQTQGMPEPVDRIAAAAHP